MQMFPRRRVSSGASPPEPAEEATFHPPPGAHRGHHPRLPAPPPEQRLHSGRHLSACQDNSPIIWGATSK